MMTIEFEDILKTVGDYGFYQKVFVIVIFIPSSAAIAMFTLGVVFLTHTPDHWCYIPEVAQSNLSITQQFQLTRPPSDSSCSTYDINYTEILRDGHLTPNNSWPTRPCNNGWHYDKANYDATAVTRWDMVCSDAVYTSLAMSVVFAGDIVGTPLFGHLSERFGRKSIFFIVVLFAALTELGSTFIPNFVSFFLFRAINGSLATTVMTSCYIAIIETVRIDKRVLINGIGTTAWSAGLCLLPLVAWGTRNWIYLSTVCSAFAFVFLLCWKLFLESPRWLISRGRYDAAFQVLLDIAKRNGIQTDEDQLKLQIKALGDKIKMDEGKKPKQSPLDLMKFPQIRKRFFLITFCWAATSCSYYGLTMTVKNLSGNEFLNFFLMSALEFPSHAVTWYCLEKFGRRYTAIGGASISAAACLLPICFDSGDGTIQMIASLIGKIGASSTFMTIYQQCPEIFPTCLRSFAMSCSVTVAVTASAATPYIVDLAYYGSYIPYMIISVLCFLNAICETFLPETLNQPMPQTIEDVECSKTVSNSFWSRLKKKAIASENSTKSPDSKTTADIKLDNIHM